MTSEMTPVIGRVARRATPEVTCRRGPDLSDEGRNRDVVRTLSPSGRKVVMTGLDTSAGEM